MAVAHGGDPTRRFTGLAESYARYRPTYPASAVDRIIARCDLRPGSVVADVGCGTGISSRLFASRGLRVIGIEPNADMRRLADTELVPAGVIAPEYRDGRAESTGLEPASVDAVLSAQAFHWFEPDATLREFHRILRPGGWVALLWNTRDERDAFTAEYGKLVQTLTNRARTPEIREDSSLALRRSSLFEAAEMVVFPNEQRLDLEALLGRAFSASYAPREPERGDAYAAALRDLFGEYARDGTASLRYLTEVHVARRRDDER